MIFILLIQSNVKTLTSSTETEKIEIDLTQVPTEVKSKKITRNEDKKQIVENTQNPFESDEPENAKYLSEKNMKTNKETVSLNKGEFKNAVNPHKTQGQQNPSTMTSHKKELNNELFKQFDPKSELQKDSKAQDSFQKNTLVGGDVSQSNDYLKDVDRGIETVLNAKEFKYYTYYNRIRRQLTQHWEPKVRDKVAKIFKQGRTIASTDDKITQLLIILNNQGTLVKIQILSDSGVLDLDEAAIEAFKAAAPFPNPPQGIIDPDGTVKIRWDFVLET